MKFHSPVSMTGTVISFTGNLCKVECDGATIDCRLRSGYSGELPVAGDEVTFSDAAGTYLLDDVRPRKTVLKRSDPRRAESSRAIAANAQILVIVTSTAQPPVRVGLIDRILAAAAAGGLYPVICLNKSDLPGADAALKLLEPYIAIDVPVVQCSAGTGVGVDGLRELVSGKTCALVGHSGVGKSSLLNALVPDLNLRTNSVRKKDGRGRHTTTVSRLYRISGDTAIIDTPGVREFGLHGISKDDLLRSFPEIERHAGGCRFADCLHTGEPGCSVTPVVRDGLIPRPRYESYRDLVHELFPGSSGSGSSGEGFKCSHCGSDISAEGGGTQHRNHCPRCLWSLHLDSRPGDRSACCGGAMEPVAVWVRKGGEWAIIHRCDECGALGSNRIAADDNEMLLMSLAARPLSNPPFPLEYIGQSV